MKGLRSGEDHMIVPFQQILRAKESSELQLTSGFVYQTDQEHKQYII